ncbi:DUF4242 domain-containing protein [Parasphingorhabdus pacifica]
MDRYVIERNLPNAGSLGEQEIRALAAKSNEVLAEIGDEVSWEQSYVSDDKLYCVYTASDPELIREHARRGGFPCDRISPVRSIIDPGSDGS